MCSKQTNCAAATIKYVKEDEIECRVFTKISSDTESTEEWTLFVKRT